MVANVQVWRESIWLSGPSKVSLRAMPNALQDCGGREMGDERRGTRGGEKGRRGLMRVDNRKGARDKGGGVHGIYMGHGT